VNFNDYCLHQAAPPGSNVYYALRQAPLARQPLLAALFALRQELEETAKEMSDPALGHTKLNWWRQELAALAAGQPTHPISSAFAAYEHSSAAHISMLNALVDGFEMNLANTRYRDFAALQHYLSRTGGLFCTLIARASTMHAANVEPWAQLLGEALQLAQLVEEVGHDARHGHVYIPVDELQRHAVPVADLLNRRYSPAFTTLMQFQTSRARTALHTALQKVPANMRRSQRTLRAQAMLALALLDEIERDGYPLLHQRLALTPIRKFWIAWWTTRMR